jgi:hypothetical protein
MMRFAHDAAVVVLLLVLRLVVLALPVVTAAAVTVLTAAMTVAGSVTKPTTALHRFPPGPARGCGGVSPGTTTRSGAFMTRPVIAALPALAAPGLLVAPAARADGRSECKEDPDTGELPIYSS